tara:strand:+ start:320 stop:469 length:150 start_codon:yes stop_codon:yes gene_type:complete
MKENFSVTKTLVEDENGELVIEFTEDELDDLGIENAEDIFKNNKEQNVD